MGDRYSHILDDEENNAFIKKLVKDAEDAVQLFIKNNNKCDTSGLSDVSMYDLMLMYDAQGGPGPNFNYLGGYEQFVKDALASKKNSEGDN